MGVPKFFRYISERYPCLSELVKEYQIPEFDNLYLDMNGIIHMCSHPNDFDPHFRITEERIFKDIFHYLEILFQIIKPRKLFFMAVDGVAPRAKMNQQRGRRFRSAKEAEVLEKKAEKRGEKLPKEARFDSNCITPGTVFMARLHEQLKYFVTEKMSNDPQWKGVKVILSGHETPGEGEHKIMEYIRWMKAQTGYDPNTRHCLYGLDADLMMLGLCTHEPHFSLLREEVKFGKQAKRTSVPEETKFYLLHLSLMREYLDLEFQSLKDKLKFPYNIESIIDDWVLMGFLVGNDFIPHLPDVHIASGALPMLYNAYMEVLPTLDGYINVQGHLKLERFQKFMEKLAAFDINQFKETYADMKYFESKTNRKLGSKDSQGDKHPLNREELKTTEPKTGISELDALIKATNEMVLEKFFDDEDGDAGILDDEEEEEDDVDVFASRIYDDDSDSEISETFRWEFHQHKKDYYRNKLEYGKVTEQVLRDQAEGYVRAIQWNLHYYYHGVASWSWYYPHHYAPYVSDICNFKDITLSFDLGEPFKPFEQLLAVLPAASKSLLPAPYQELMIQESSPILEYYPPEFQTDLNGKKQDWEAVVLIPFIDEKKLLSAMVSCEDRLTDDEKKRNKFGPMLEYTFSSDTLGEYNAPQYFPTIKNSHAFAREIWRKDLHLNSEDIKHGLPDGVRLDVFFPGFPTFKHLPYKGSLKKAKVQVFDQASRGENMVLTLLNTCSLSLKDAADHFLGKNVYCGWPHLSEAKVIGVADGSKRYNLLTTGKVALENLSSNLCDQYEATKKALSNEYMRRRGVDIGCTKFIVYVNHVVGRKYVFGQTGKITMEKQYSEIQDPYAIQAVVEDIAVHDPSFVQFRTLEEVFPVGSYCFLLASPVYGSMAEVTEVKMKEGRVFLKISTNGEPDVDFVRYNQHSFKSQYMPGSKAAQQIGIGSHTLSRITGTVFLIVGNKQADNPSKINIGLNLKFNKKNEEVPGFTKKENNIWLYSRKAIAVLKEYVEKFPEVFELLSKQTSNDMYDDKDIYPDENCAEKVNELSKWLKEVPCANVDRQSCGAQILDDEVVSQIYDVVKAFYENPPDPKRLKLQVKPHTVFKYSLRVGNLAPDSSTSFQLFDRVVNVRDDFTVPLGLKGTIIAIRPAENEADTMFDVLFDNEFPSGMSLAGTKGNSYRVSRTALISISHGLRQGLIHESYRNSQTQPQPNSAFAKWSARGKGGNNTNQAFLNLCSAPMGNEPLPSKGLNKEKPSIRKQSEFPRNSGCFKFPAPPNVQILSKENSKSSVTTKSQQCNQAQMNVVKVKTRNGLCDPPPPTALPIPSKSMANEIDSKTNALKMILGVNPSASTPQDRASSIPVAGTTGFIVSPTCEISPYAQDVCGFLLQFFQRKGVGVPLYSVASMGTDVYARLLLPDGTIVNGKPSLTKQGAAENAAFQALHLLKVCRVCDNEKMPSLSELPPNQIQPEPSRQLSGQPQQFFEQFRQGNFPSHPGIVSGNPPWQHSGHIHPAHARNSLPVGPPSFPQHLYNYQLTSQPSVNHQFNQLSGNYQLPLQPAPNQQFRHQPQHTSFVSQHQPPKKGHHQTNSNQPKKEDGAGKKSHNDSNSFVPLQAMKKQRHVRKPQLHQVPKERESTKRSCSNFEETSTSREEKETLTSRKNVTDPSIDPETDKGCHKSIAPSYKDMKDETRSFSRMKKSRLAINFSSN
ncbi:5'-3' exoribonuclease 1 [Frankliniella fusca]|uniref:5'-3' exoribonuclease 1 n=1 Tax=Frankliniella fusca TaxID=407009 RepID=A0AAE1LAR9_9NEOP|nr:5'-3' exoribonuclease 1 [Frankliniella fusca]